MVITEETKVRVIDIKSKNVFFLSLFLFLLISFGQASSFCCQTFSGSKTYNCYSSGFCCKMGTYKEYWDPNGCFDFEVWVEPNKMAFTIGRKTNVNLYIKNLEAYSDSYNVSYWIDSPNPSLISVDLIGVTPTEIVFPFSTEKFYPRITILSAQASGTVWFNVTSSGNPGIQRNASLDISSSGMPISLPEFNSNFFLLLLLMILSGLIYIYIFKNKS